MAGQEIRIENFKDTLFYEIAVKSNVNGGTTLKGVEIQLFEQATEGMDVSLEQYGLSVGKEEVTAKQARKNIANQGEELEKLYKTQFGKQGRQAVDSSEARANAMVETAKLSFERNHKDIKFIPEEFAKRPLFTEAKYANNPTAYAADLVAWAKDVAASYDLHDKMSNEELAAAVAKVVIRKADEVILNDDLNTDRLSDEMRQLGNQILQELEEGKAEIIQTVKNAEGHIVKTIRSAEGHIVKVVQDAERNIITVTQIEGAITRNEVRAQGAMTRNTVREEGTMTRNEVHREAANSRNTTRQTARETQEIETINTAIAERLASKGAKTPLAGKISNLQSRIVESNMTHDEKMKFLRELSGIAFTEKNIGEFERRLIIAEKNAVYNPQNEYPIYESYPEPEFPYLESPFLPVQENGGNSFPSSNGVAPDSKVKENVTPPMPEDVVEDEEPTETEPVVKAPKDIENNNFGPEPKDFDEEKVIKGKKVPFEEIVLRKKQNKNEIYNK